MPKRFFNPARNQNLLTDRRGLAAVEFALIAPALIFMFLGVLEMSLRFRASEEASRYVHQVADLVSRETELDIDDLEEIYGASVHMMRPLDTTDRLDFDASSVGFEGAGEPEPFVMWRRVGGAPVDFDVIEAEGLGQVGESVIRIGIRYRYDSPITTLFGGPTLMIERSAYARPRQERLIAMDGETDDGGGIVYFDS